MSDLYCTVEAFGKNSNNFLSVSQGSLEIVLYRIVHGPNIRHQSHTLCSFCSVYIFNPLIKFIP